MTTSRTLRVHEAQELISSLEDAILQTRHEHADLEPRVLAAYVKSMLDDLYELRARLDAELGLEQLRSGQAAVWVTLKGGRTGSGRAPLRAVGRVLESIQTGVRQTAAFLLTGSAALGRVPRDIELGATLEMVGFEPGSARVAVEPADTQIDIQLGAPVAERSLERIVAALTWAESKGKDESLAVILPDSTLRRQILTRVKEIAPSGPGDYELVALSGRLLQSGQSVRLTPLAFEHASHYLRRRQEEAVTYQGQLVAIDFEKVVFDLRYGARRIHCHFDPDMRDRAKAYGNTFVEVTGIGVFQEDTETPTRINVKALRRLTPAEQGRL